jgi:hypothetical protein
MGFCKAVSRGAALARLDSAVLRAIGPIKRKTILGYRFLTEYILVMLLLHADALLQKCETAHSGFVSIHRLPICHSNIEVQEEKYA